MDLIVTGIDDPIVGRLLHGQVLHLLAAGFAPVIRSEALYRGTKGLPPDRVDAVSGIVVVNLPDEADEPTLARDIPLGTITLVTHGSSRLGHSVTHLGPDDAGAIDVSVRHLVSLGHTQIGYISGAPEVFSHRQRVAAFERVARDVEPAGSATAPQVVYAQQTFEGGERAAKQLISAGCTAVVCASDTLALGAVQGARHLGLRVPENFSVIGHGDTSLVAHADPALTTIRLPFERLCRAAVDVLETLRDGDSTQLGALLFRPELIIRRSTGPAPSRGGSR